MENVTKPRIHAVSIYHVKFGCRWFIQEHNYWIFFYPGLNSKICTSKRFTALEQCTRFFIVNHILYQIYCIYLSIKVNPLHKVPCQQTIKYFLHIFFKNIKILNCQYHIWIQHKKCIQMSPNKPSIDPVVLEIALMILRKFQFFDTATLSSPACIAFKCNTRSPWNNHNVPSVDLEATVMLDDFNFKWVLFFPLGTQRYYGCTWPRGFQRLSNVSLLAF